MSAHLPAFLLLTRRLLERTGMDPIAAKAVVWDLITELEGVPLPSPLEIKQFCKDSRALELMNQGVRAEVIALRTGCSRGTAYKRINRALELKRIA